MIVATVRCSAAIANRLWPEQDREYAAHRDRFWFAVIPYGTQPFVTLLDAGLTADIGRRSEP